MKREDFSDDGIVCLIFKTITLRNWGALKLHA